MEDDREPPCVALGEQRSKVRVRRDEDAIVLSVLVEDLLIGRRFESEVSHVLGVVAAGLEQFR